LKFEIDAVNLQVGRLLMNGILNDESLPVGRRGLRRNRRFIEAKKLVSSQFQNQQSQISNFEFRIIRGR